MNGLISPILGRDMAREPTGPGPAGPLPDHLAIPAAGPSWKIGLLFTLDYEIYGTGAGDPYALMVQPTERLLSLLDAHGARLTIMAEVAEILAFKREPRFAAAAEAIEAQLRSAVARGHDVQLHLHPAWFNGRHDGARWHLDFSEYSLAGLPAERVSRYLREGKEYLEGLLRPVRPDYRCLAFRAGNWLIQPERDVVAGLESNGFRFDTTVFKHGWGAAGPYVLDYRDAHDELLSWVVDPGDINRAASRDGLREIPIFSQRVLITSMLTPRRLAMQRHLRRSIAEAGEPGSPEPQGTGKQVSRLRLFYPKKFDFCRMTFRELRKCLEHALDRCAGTDGGVPMVAIGHSTELADMAPLQRFLEHVESACRGQVGWTTFGECPA
jgi:hypothetical protein